MQTPAGRNSRRHQRVRLRLPVAYTYRGETSYSSSYDLCQGGAFIETNLPLPLQARFPLRVWLGRRAKPEARVLDFSARVVHHGNGRGMGLCFEQTSTLDKSLHGQSPERPRQR